MLHLTQLAVCILLKVLGYMLVIILITPDIPFRFDDY